MPTIKIIHKKPFAIVTGLEYMQGIQTARIFSKRHHISVIGVTNDEQHPFCSTNCCEKIVFSNNKLFDCLKSIGEKLIEKSVLVPCTDEDVLTVSRNRDCLSKWFYICMPDADVVEMMMDKLRFYKFAKQAGFPIPDTYFIYDHEDLERSIPEVRFPCVFKPHFRTSAWNELSFFKAFKVTTAQQLRTLFDNYKTGSDCFILQNWIEGPDANLYSCNAYFNARSEPLVTFVARKIRQWPPEMGQSALGEECRNDVVLRETVRLFQQVGFYGLGYLELKRDQNSGQYYIVEPNICRPTGRSAIAEGGGVELLYTMYCDVLGWPLPPSSQRVQKYAGVKWIHIRQDLQASVYYWRKGELTIKEWFKSLCGPKVFAVFSWADPGPFWRDLIRTLRLLVNTVERRRRNPNRPF